MKKQDYIMHVAMFPWYSDMILDHPTRSLQKRCYAFAAYFGVWSSVVCFSRRTSLHESWQTCVRGLSRLSGPNELNPYLSYLVPYDKESRLPGLTEEQTLSKTWWVVLLLRTKFHTLKNGIKILHEDCGKSKNICHLFFI